MLLLLELCNDGDTGKNTIGDTTAKILHFVYGECAKFANANKWYVSWAALPCITN